MAPALDSDDIPRVTEGGLSANDSAITSEDLMHGSEHHDDTSRMFRQEFGRRGMPSSSSSSGAVALPRDRLIKMIEDLGYTRPTPKHWQS